MAAPDYRRSAFRRHSGGELGLEFSNRRQETRARHVVVHEAGSQELAGFGVVGAVLAEHLPRALRQAVNETAQRAASATLEPEQVEKQRRILQDALRVQCM